MRLSKEIMRMPFKFTKLPIEDVIQIEPVRFKDDRGFFEEVFKISDFKNFGMDINIKQINFLLWNTFAIQIN